MLVMYPATDRLAGTVPVSGSGKYEVEYNSTSCPSARLPNYPFFLSHKGFLPLDLITMADLEAFSSEAQVVFAIPELFEQVGHYF
jgi:hypothetical protein